MNFECAEKWKIGMIGFCFLFGIVVGSSTITRLGDVYGRKPIYLLGLLMNLIVVVTLIVAKRVLVGYICLFVLGLSVTARYYVGYAYNIEM